MDMKWAFQGLPIGLCYFDCGLRYVYINDWLAKLNGISAEDHVGRTIDDVLPHVAEHVKQTLQQVIDSGEPLLDGEVTAETPAQPGVMRTFSHNYIPVKSDDGAVVGLSCVVEEITELRAAEEALRQSQRMEAIGQLAGGIAHDFNNILFVINSNLHFLGEGLDRDHENYEMIEALKAAGQLGGKLTEQLLSFGGRRPLKPKLVDVAGSVADIVKLLRQTLPENIRIETALAEGSGWSRIDSTQFESALLNLAINAWRAMPDGGVLALSVEETRLAADDVDRLASLKPGKYVLVTMRDIGVGMPPQTVDKAFEPYFSTKEPGAGSGLGLSMVYGFAKQSAGHVTLESRLDEGTTVRLFLPVAQSRIGKQPPIASRSASNSTGRETILVVEDDALVMRATVKMLESLGYQTLQAHNGVDALASLDQENSVDLLLTDMVMPGGMDGDRLASVARRLRPGLKVLFASGYAERAAARLGELQDDAQLIFKPYPIELLATTLRTILDRPSG